VAVSDLLYNEASYDVLTAVDREYVVAGYRAVLRFELGVNRGSLFSTPTTGQGGSNVGLEQRFLVGRTG
jgi:hypothetical protein